MPEALGDDFDMHPCRESQARVGVAQVVEADAGEPERRTCLLNAWLNTPGRRGDPSSPQKTRSCSR